MNPLLHWLTSPEWAHIVKALLHSLWQGAVITAALALLLRRITNPETRYRVMLSALAALVLTSVATWGLLTAPQAAAPTISPPSLPYSTPPLAPTGPVDKFIVPANWTAAQPQVQWTAWLALAWLLGTSAMLGRASVKVAGAEKLRRACQPLDDPRITELVAAASRAVKLTRRVRVAVTNQLTSPAVVGVLVPTLILPLSLITMLSPEQLRFVLLHELAHIRRRDYLANLFQLFAEALFFFNPAVWWLSHQIRREREACCDALAIELSGAPADYARTLVSVAETILNPSPAAAPAFGNDREPSSLADRVQRVLVPGYRPSLRLTWRAMLAALLAGGVVLALLATGTRETIAAILPAAAKETLRSRMADETNTTSVASASPSDTNSVASQTTVIGLRETVASATTNQNTLYTRTFKISSNDFPRLSKFFPKTTSPSEAPPPRFSSYSIVKGTISVTGTRQDLDEIGSIIEPLSPLAPAPANPRQEIVTKLEGIRLDSAAFDAVPLTEVVRFLADECRKRDPDKRGINFFVAPRVDQTALGPFGPVTNTSMPMDMSSVVIKISSPLKDVNFGNLLDVIVKSADKPIQYSIQDYGVIFSTRETNNIPLYTRTFKVSSNELARAMVSPDLSSATKMQEKVREFFARNGADIKAPGKAIFYNERQGMLFVRAALEDMDKIESAIGQKVLTLPQVHISANLGTRTFRVDPRTLAERLGEPTGSEAANVTRRLRDRFTAAGVDLQPADKSVVYNDHAGELFVRATQAELILIEQTLDVLTRPTPQVNIRAKFVEMPEKIAAKLLANLLTTNAQQKITGTITEAQAKALFKSLKETKGVEILSGPDVTTLSGRQAQIFIGATKDLVIGISNAISADGSQTNLPQTTTKPFGTTLDLIPSVVEQGYAIHLEAIPTITEFLGYDVPGRMPAKATERTKFPTAGEFLPQPHYRLRQTVAIATVWDSQTLILGGLQSEWATLQPDGTEVRKPDPAAPKKQLFVFITPTVIDRAGNRKHAEIDAISLQNHLMPAIRPQPGDKKIYDRYDGPKPLPGEKALQR